MDAGTLLDVGENQWLDSALACVLEMMQAQIPLALDHPEHDFLFLRCGHAAQKWIAFVGMLESWIGSNIRFVYFNRSGQRGLEFSRHRRITNPVQYEPCGLLRDT